MSSLMIIYKMARSLYNEALRASTAERNSSYPIFMKRYNELAEQIIKETGNLPLLTKNLTWPDPKSVESSECSEYLDEAIVAIGQMVAFLEEQLATYLDHSFEYNEEINEIIATDVEQKLRFTIRTEPSNEKQIQDAVENLLRIRDYEFEREKVTIPYSTKYFVPDFTFEPLRVAMDVKFCNSTGDEKRIIDQINSDIPGFKCKYLNLIFVVYDMGIIRDQIGFRKGIEENNSGVRVVIVKH